MMTLYVFRERLRTIYQKYELFIEPVLKFIMGFVVFTLINRAIGYEERLTGIPMVLLLSLFTAFVPSAVFVSITALVVFVHVFSISKILSILIVMIMLILYLLFIRLTPKYGIVVVAVPVLYLMKIPYVIPLVLGVVATPITAVATTCGIVIFYLFQIIQQAATVQVSVSLEDTLQLYTYVCQNLIENKQMFMSIIIFIVVMSITYVVRKLKIDYAYEIAIGVGAISCMLCFLISDLRLDISEQILTMIIGTIISAVITYIVMFFKQALDYTGVERLQFEDDDYYYYVKAVPKINVTTPQKNVKKINAKEDKDDISEIDVSFEDTEDEETGEFYEVTK